MWPLTNVSDEQVIFCIRPATLLCCWVQRPGKQASLKVKACKIFDLDPVAVTPHTIANPTVLTHYMKNFLKAYELLDARINIVLSEPHVSQNIIMLPNAIPELSQVCISGKKQVVWDYYYLYPTEDNKHVFYTCAVDQSLLLQYKLMAVRAQLNFNIITTQYTALFNLYRYMYGAAFRASQLAIDMVKYGNRPERLLTYEIVRRVVSMPLEIGKNGQEGADFIDILSSCGLFVMGDKA